MFDLAVPLHNYVALRAAMELDGDPRPDIRRSSWD
jgi:hypothetical protein